jgi:uncharacterized protein YukE
MNARKTSCRTKQQHFGTLVDDLKKVTGHMEMARQGIAADYWSRDLDRLNAGISDLNRIIHELDLTGGAS